MNDLSMAAGFGGRADRYAMLVEHTPTPIWVLDTRRAHSLLEPLRTQGVNDLARHLEQRPELLTAAIDSLRVVEANRAAAALLRADDPAMLTRSARHLFAASSGLAARVIAAVLEARREHVEQVRLETFDGDVRDVVMTIAFAAGDTTIVTVQDISEHLQAQAQLRELRAEYAHAARISMLGEMATSIAHEVRQPLAAIVTNADTSLRWLAHDQPNLTKVAELTDRIAASAQRASDIIQRVRDMALKHEPERAFLDLAEVIDGALHFVRHDLDTRGIELAVLLDEGLGPVAGDRVQLQQVVVNLLVNGIHAIDDAGSARRRIEVRVEALSADTAMLSVCDSGPGFTDAAAARLFEGFFSTKPNGMGIGLTICQSIVSDHGGEISAANAPAGGAVFRVVLPFAKPTR